MNTFTCRRPTDNLIRAIIMRKMFINILMNKKESSRAATFFIED